MVGRVAVDLSHLVAELVENATSFSPPTTPVSLRAEREANGYRLWVIDAGVGMTPGELAEANERLASPPDIDDLIADRVGFQVVGRLARRLGVRVMLQPSATGGVAASVELPVSGNPSLYPFDTYELVLGVTLQATRPDGTLIPRGESGAVVEDPALAAERTRLFLRDGLIETVCIHADTTSAVALARAVRAVLDEAERGRDPVR